MTQPDAYPLPRPTGGESRFTYGLSIDVASVLVQHGFPALSPTDYVRLQQALFQFIYERPEADTRA